MTNTNLKQHLKEIHAYSGFLLRFEVPGTNVLIAGTKDGVTAAIFAWSAKWEGSAPPPGGSGGPPQKMLEFLRRQGVFWAISGQFGFLLVSLNKAFAA